MDAPASVVTAAKLALRHRFSSFVPFAYRLETAIAAAQANLIEHDGPCTCMTARAEEKAEREANAQPEENVGLCKGSMYQKYRL